ncbi:MAG: prolipoprotein diacylglyceryl transferase [Anaerolineae bacterium]|nr:prolipoprotein diacylglyceryl transferase [Gemmatimonadaceae bacterium]
MPIVHHPFSYGVGPLEITGFGLAVLLGFVIGQIIGKRELARRGFDPEPVGDIVFAAVIGFLIGAKVYYAILVGDASALLSRGGFVFWGGLTGGVLAGLWMTWRKGMPLMRICDVGGIGIAAGYAVGRTGCFAVGDDYGRPWNSPFAVAFPEGAPPSTAANMQAEFGIPVPEGVAPEAVLGVHPTQLYETALGFLMFAILWRMRGHKHAEGWLFGVYLLLAGLERFAVEFLRAKDDRFFAGLTLAQVIALGMLAGGAVWMWARREKLPGLAL